MSSFYTLPPGGNFPIGGGVVSGGGVKTGGDLRIGGTLGLPTDGRSYRDSIQHMGAHLLTMKPHEWSMMQEGAAQLLGAPGHPHWGEFNIKDRILKAGKHHYQNIMNAATAKNAVDHLNHDEGGGFYEALKHTYDTVAGSARKVGHWFNKYSPYVEKTADVLAQVPAFAPYADWAPALKEGIREVRGINDQVQGALDLTDQGMRFAEGAFGGGF